MGLEFERQFPEYQNIYAEKAFTINGRHCRKDDKFPGTICYYYEVTNMSIYGFVIVLIETTNSIKVAFL
jgi:hypothetical protein